jgi:adenosine deaminase
MGLDRALARFVFTLGRLDRADRLTRVAHEVCEDAAQEGVSTLEVRFGPLLHGDLAPADVLDAVIEGIGGRAGVLLCGLYGDAPETFDALVDLAKPRPQVVGLDVAGAPQRDHTWGLRDYQKPMQRARNLGLGVTIHAGEGRPAEEIRVAIEMLGATRIGHGTTLLDDPGVLEQVVERGVTLEACITSNVHVGAIPSADAHPLAAWLKQGVKACVCTDNPLFSEVTSSSEHALARQLPGMTDDLLDQAIRHGHEARFTR